jgi:LPXTG-site transpeptidase (sortase) family protein
LAWFLRYEKSMQSKISLKWLLIILGIETIVCFSTIAFFLTFALNNQSSYAKSVLSTGNQALQNTSELPIRLTIPKINVDADIKYVGLTPQGAMAVPAGPMDTAWFDLGPYPGEDGSAVIAGHEGWKDGIQAVFDDLYQLHIGDKVYVEDKKGTITTFVVRSIETYDQNGNASDVFSSNDGKAHLNLITCEGTWNAAQKSYSNRLVVFTDME